MAVVAQQQTTHHPQPVVLDRVVAHVERRERVVELDGARNHVGRDGVVRDVERRDRTLLSAQHLDKEDADRRVSQLIGRELQLLEEQAHALLQRLEETSAAAVAQANLGQVERAERRRLRALQLLEHAPALRRGSGVEPKRLDGLVDGEQRTHDGARPPVQRCRHAVVLLVGLLDGEPHIPQVDLLDAPIAVELLNGQDGQRDLRATPWVLEVERLERRVGLERFGERLHVLGHHGAERELREGRVGAEKSAEQYKGAERPDVLAISQVVDVAGHARVKLIDVTVAHLALLVREESAAELLALGLAEVAAGRHGDLGQGLVGLEHAGEHDRVARLRGLPRERARLLVEGEDVALQETELVAALEQRAPYHLLGSRVQMKRTLHTRHGLRLDDANRFQAEPFDA